MLNKKQMLERIAWILGHKGIANYKWMVEQFEGLESSAISPEVF